MPTFTKIPVDLERQVYDYVGTGSPATLLANAPAGATYRDLSGGSGSMLWQKTTAGWEPLGSSNWNQALADTLYARLAASNTMTNAVPFLFNNASSNWLQWGTAGGGPPSFTARSAGTKLLIYPSFVASTQADYAIGIDTNTMWFGVGANTALFKWYGGLTLAAILTGAGVLTLNPANAGQSNAFLVARVAGNSFEFGHNNTAGYGCTIGAETSSGLPFLAFNAELTAGTNLYTTRGIKGSVFRSDINGGFSWSTVANTNAANQSPTGLMTLSSGGALTILTAPVFSLVLSGAPTQNLQIGMGTSSVFGAIGGMFSSGYQFITYNAYMPTPSADSWTQSLGSNPSGMLEVRPDGFAFYVAASGRSTGNKATFWGSPYWQMSSAIIVTANTYNARNSFTAMTTFCSEVSTFDYSNASLMLREYQNLTTGTEKGPHLAFHWGGVVASQITMEWAGHGGITTGQTGRIAIVNNPGTGYEDFIAKNITASANLIAVGQITGGSMIITGASTLGSATIGGYAVPAVRSGSATSIPGDLVAGQMYFGY